MIRQTITCDACGIERKEVNHWFEAFEHEGELRIRGLILSKTTRPGLRHLCGQTCLHRLVDDFMAGNLSTRMFGVHDEAKMPTDYAQLASESSHEPEMSEFESSARLIQSPVANSRNVPRSPAPARKTTTAVRKQRVTSLVDSSSPKGRPHSPPAASLISPSSLSVTPAGASKASSGPSVASMPSLPAASAAPASRVASNAVTTPLTLPNPTSAVTTSPKHPAAAVPRPGAPRSAFSSSSNRLSAAAPISTAASAAAISEPPSSLTPQNRRAQAWERELARERQAAEKQSREKKGQRLF